MNQSHAIIAQEILGKCGDKWYDVLEEMIMIFRRLDMFINLSVEDKERHIKELSGEKCRFSGKSAGVIKKVQGIQKNTRSNPEKLVLVEGIWGAKMLVKYNVEVKALLLCAAEITNEETYQLVVDLIHRTDEVHLVSESTFKKMAEVGTSAGILALAQMPQKTMKDLNPKQHKSIVVLDGLEIPGNVGTIIRSCDGTDTDAVVICNRKTRLSHPKILRSSQGSCFNVPIVEDEAEEVMAWLTKNGYKIILTDTRSDAFYFEESYNGKIAIVMGSERYGISREWYNLETTNIKIPMWGDCDSLNVGIAATIILYEAAVKRKGMLKRG